MRRIKTVILIVALFISVIGCQKKDDKTFMLDSGDVADIDESTEENADSNDEMEYIFVYVCGAVNKEGVYELPSGSRVYEAIDIAGGFRGDADIKNVNQAEVLEDEERIYIPVVGEVVEADSTQDGKININKASKEELMTLPGVGESRAESIIEYRESQGGFDSIEDIMQVSGIKEGLFEKIKDLITI